MNDDPLLSPDGPRASEPPMARDRRRHPRMSTAPDPEPAPPRSHARPRGWLWSRAAHALLHPQTALPWLRRSRCPGRDRAPARGARLPTIARRLEAIVLELDELGAWREAADLSSALERLRARAD